MTRPTVHVRMDRNNPQRGRVTIDGHEIHGVRAVDVRHAYDDVPAVAFEIIAEAATVEYVDTLNDDTPEATR